MPSKFYLSSREIDFTPPKYPDLFFDSNLAKAEIYNALIIAGIPEKNILDLSEIEELKGNKWRRYYFLHDAHLNEDGNHLVAGYISRKLRGN